MTTCPDDPQLLLSVHQGLTATEAVRVAWHCLGCRACRRRRRELLSVSHALAGALRPAGSVVRPIGATIHWWRAALLGGLGATMVVALLIRERPEPVVASRARAPMPGAGHNFSDCTRCHSPEELKRLSRRPTGGSLTGATHLRPPKKALQ